MPTLRRLVRGLPGDLLPVGDASLDVEVSAVHVSELLDPTPYLDGGELLLTTGLGLTGQVTQARAYATRLAERGLAGLAIGLGPVHAEVPPAVAAACAAAGLPLLVVPIPTPFLAVTRSVYWSLLTADGHAELSAALGAHRDLGQGSDDPQPGLRRGAGAVELRARLGRSARASTVSWSRSGPGGTRRWPGGCGTTSSGCAPPVRTPRPPSPSTVTT